MSLTPWIRASYALGIGYQTLQKALAVYSNLAAAMADFPNSARKLGWTPSTIANLDKVTDAQIEATLSWAEQPNHHIITVDDPRYPPQLRQIDSPPIVLYVIGNPEVLRSPQIAMVGSRYPTAYGKNNATEFARHFGKCGLTITSGLAKGVDATSHQGALDAGTDTIAVCGTGLWQGYPRAHQKLAATITERGALISEFPLDMDVRRNNFPRRNRIISGLSVATLVVEANIQSGSLITARFAMEQGRYVFTIPGSIHAPQSKGCHQLIRQGATLIESAAELLAECKPALQPFLQQHEAIEPAIQQDEYSLTLDPNYQKLLDIIDTAGTSIDTIIAASGLTPPQVSSMLLTMELNDLVTPVPRGYAKIK